MAVGELCTEILLLAQNIEQSYVTGHDVTYCLRSLNVSLPDPFFLVTIGKGSGYARLGERRRLGRCN